MILVKCTKCNAMIDARPICLGFSHDYLETMYSGGQLLSKDRMLGRGGSEGGGDGGAGVAPGVQTLVSSCTCPADNSTNILYEEKFPRFLFHKLIRIHFLK